MDDRKLWAAHFLVVPLCCGIVCASIHSLRESTHVGLTSVAGRWAWCLLAMKATSVAVGGEWSAFWLSCIRMVRDDDHGKHSQSEGFSRGSRSSPPRRMVTAVGAHWLSVMNR
jgi:hypothetical protein